MTTGDKILLAGLVAYGAVDLVLMGLFARGAFGPTPRSVLYAFICASAAGTLTCLTLLAIADRSQISWRIALATTVGFGLLTAFNLWCLSTAAAAV